MNTEKFEPHVPSLPELVSVLGEGLKSYFAEVKVELVDCPDFREKPYKLAINGLHGQPIIADVGGGKCRSKVSVNWLFSNTNCLILQVHNLIPHVNLESKFDLSMVVKAVYGSNDEHYPAVAFGPGGGSFSSLGMCCEFMGSAKYEHDSNGVQMVSCACRYVYVDDDGKGQLREQVNDDRFGLMGNFYLSQNKVGKVLKIHTKKRIAKENYTQAVRAVLLSKYGPEKPVSMGGVFLINSGNAKLHIMPKYWPKEPSTDESVNNEWLKYYNITKHPLVCLSVFHSHDPGFNLRMEHTHCFNLDTQDEAGHYHYDITPDIVEYEGYFNVAEMVYRLN